MNRSPHALVFLHLLIGWVSGLPSTAAPAASLFDGRSLAGWRFVGTSSTGLTATNGTLVLGEATRGVLYSEKEFENGVFRFEFRTATNAAGGVAVRAPRYGDPVTHGLFIHLRDDHGSRASVLGDAPPSGSLADVAPARKGLLKPAGQWNRQEVRLEGRWLTVTLNSFDVLTLNLNEIRQAEVLAGHPGLLRPAGNLALVAQGSRVEFRQLSFEELPSNFARTNQSPYPGFVALYNGTDLSGWRHQLAEPYDNPHRRANLTPAELRRLQLESDKTLAEHWKSVEGVLTYDGKGRSLCTVDDYGDFEMFADWKIGADADSGIYLRGYPQVQIWDPFHPNKYGSSVGSGGLYNNEKGPSRPLVVADRPLGEWNRFHILFRAERVTVFLNGDLVVHNVPLENYWDRQRSLLPTGPIELQHHGQPLWFRNLYLRILD